MKISQNIAISENGFLFNPATGDSFSTNACGKEIIRPKGSNFWLNKS